MKRNKDLVKDILLSIEAGYIGIKSDVTTDQDIIDYHLDLLVDGGLLRVQMIDQEKWYGLTWQGYELLDLLRDRRTTEPDRIPVNVLLDRMPAKTLPVGNVIKMEE